MQLYIHQNAGLQATNHLKKKRLGDHYWFFKKRPPIKIETFRFLLEQSHHKKCTEMNITYFSNIKCIKSISLFIKRQEFLMGYSNSRKKSRSTWLFSYIQPGLEKQHPSDIQLSERLACLPASWGPNWWHLWNPPVHHRALSYRGDQGVALNWAPLGRETPASRTEPMLDFPRPYWWWWWWFSVFNK